MSRLDINTVNTKWVLHVDESSNFRGAELGILLKSPQGDIIPRAISCDFKAIDVEVYRDSSLLIVSRIKGEFATKDSKMIAYLEVVRWKVKKFKFRYSSNSHGPKYVGRRTSHHWISHENIRIQKNTYNSLGDAGD